MTMMPQVIQFQPRPQNPVFRRPRMLVRAARAGLSGYSRKRDLPRLLKNAELPPPVTALARLKAEEELLDLARRECRADYDLQRHVLLLIAILAEMEELAPRPVTWPGTAIQARP